MMISPHNLSSMQEESKIDNDNISMVHMRQAFYDKR